jgi:hypothetical protein
MMTSEQAKQYEICKIRRHEEAVSDHYARSYQNQQLQAASTGGVWKRCRWCGTEYQEVPEIRQVERS